jgi:hypothetical protein
MVYGWYEEDCKRARSILSVRWSFLIATEPTFTSLPRSTHTPSAFRPGRISDALREGFERAGYPLQTDRLARPGVIEVYPHPALVELAGALERLPYKTSKVGSYWPLATPQERRTLMARIDLDLEALTEAGGLVMRPGHKPKINADVASSYDRRSLPRKRPRGLGNRSYRHRAPLWVPVRQSPLFGCRVCLRPAVCWTLVEIVSDDQGVGWGTCPESDYARAR